MEIKNNSDEDVKKSRLDADSEIYNKKRSDKLDKEAFKEFSTKEKLLYYKEYYLPYTLIIIALVAVFTYVAVSIHKTNQVKDTIYCGMIAGVQFDKDTMDKMPELFADYLKNETDYNGYINVDRTYFEVFYATFTDNSKLDNFFDKKRFDVFITRDDSFKSYVASGTIQDLSNILPDDVLEKLEDKIVYATVDGSNEPIPYGILLDDIDYKFYDGGGDTINPPILSIPYNTKRPEVARYFIEFITQ